MNTKNEKTIMSLINLADGKSAVIDDKTPLMILIEGKMEKEALALIDTGKSQPEYMDKYKRTALRYAMDFGLEKVALALIDTGKIDLSQLDVDNYTPLLIACNYKMAKVALALIATGKSKPEIVGAYKNTALIYACWQSMETVALALLETGSSNYQAKDLEGKDALHYAKQRNLTKVVEKIESMMKLTTASQIPTPTPKEYENLSLALLKFIDSTMGEPTPLIYFIKTGKLKEAMTLIATGQGQFDKKTIHGNTALQLACQDNKPDLALALIATGKSLPENVNNDSDTALLYTVQFSYHENVALALLETGKSNYQHTNRTGYDALYYAKKYNMTKAVKKIESLIALTSTSTSSTLKCLSCQKDLEKATHVVVPCGHSQFHSDCIWRESCPVCNTKISSVVKLQ